MKANFRLCGKIQHILEGTETPDFRKLRPQRRTEGAVRRAQDRLRDAAQVEVSRGAFRTEVSGLRLLKQITPRTSSRPFPSVSASTLRFLRPSDVLFPSRSSVRRVPASIPDSSATPSELHLPGADVDAHHPGQSHRKQHRDNRAQRRHASPYIRQKKTHLRQTRRQVKVCERTLLPDLRSV